MNELFHNINKMAKASKVKKTRNTNQYAHISPVQPFTQQSSSFSRLNYKIPQSHQKFTRSSHDIRPETLINSLKVSQNKLFEKGNMNNWKEQIHLDFGQGSMIKRIIPQRLPNQTIIQTLHQTPKQAHRQLPIQTNSDIKHDISKQLNMNYKDSDFDPKKKAVTKAAKRKFS